MNGLLLKPAITVAGGSLLCSNPTAAQVFPPAKRVERVDITKGPALELARDGLPLSVGSPTTSGGSPVGYAVVHYGTDSDDLSQIAKNHIRLNQKHPETIFRVLMHGLKPQTSYY